MGRVTVKARKLAKALNEGLSVETAIRDAGFDPDGEANDPVLPEAPELTFEESSLIDCGWDDDKSITIENHDGEWLVFSKQKVPGRKPAEVYGGKFEQTIVIDYDHGVVEFPGMGVLEIAVIWREARNYMLSQGWGEPDEFLRQAAELVAPR